MLNLAVSAVAVFFVLSGFTIRLITVTRPVTARDYAVHRFSRIYSVMVPAVLFTIAVAVLLHWGPATRLGRDEFNLKKLVLQGMTNLTFTGAIWNLDIPVGFNGVFWSLCYEWAYYSFYGLAFFARGWLRWVSLVALTLFVGPPILLLLPLWLFGCLIHDVYQKLRGGREALGYVTGVLAVAGTLAVVLAQRLRGLAPAAAGAAERTGLIRLLEWSREHDLHLLQRSSFHAYVIGVPAGLLILWLLLLAERVSLRRDHPVNKIVRTVANGTFALYLLHLPAFMLIAAYVPYDRSSSVQKVGLMAAVVVFSVLIEIPLDRLKRLLRSRLSTSRSTPRSVMSAS